MRQHLRINHNKAYKELSEYTRNIFYQTVFPKGFKSMLFHVSGSQPNDIPAKSETVSGIGENITETVLGIDALGNCSENTQQAEIGVINPKLVDGYASAVRLDGKIVATGIPQQVLLNMKIYQCVKQNEGSKMRTDEFVYSYESLERIRRSCREWLKMCSDVVGQTTSAMKSLVSGCLSESTHRLNLSPIKPLQEKSSHDAYVKVLVDLAYFVMNAKAFCKGKTSFENEKKDIFSTFPAGIDYHVDKLISFSCTERGILNDKEMENELTECLHQIFIRVLTQPSSLSDGDNSLLVYFFILSWSIAKDNSIEKDKGRKENANLRPRRGGDGQESTFCETALRLCTAKEVSGMLAALQYASRAGALLDLSKNSPFRKCLLSESQVSVRDEDIMNALADRFQFDRISAFSCIRYFLDVAMKVLSVNGGGFHFSDCFLTGKNHGIGVCGVIDHAHHISFPAMGKMIRNMQSKAFGKVKLLVESECQTILRSGLAEDLLRIVDDMNALTPGLNFLHLAKNSHGSEMRKEVFRLVESCLTKIRGSSIVEGQPSPSKILELVKSIADRCEDVMKNLIFIMHLVGGGPARAKELATLKHKNTAGAQRNFFIMQGLVCVESEYRKTRNRKGAETTKRIYGFLDFETSKLFVLYLVILRPLYEFSVNSLVEMDGCEPNIEMISVPGKYRNNVTMETFCWSWRRRESEGETSVCDIINRAFRTVGVNLSVASYRQWQAGMASTNEIEQLRHGDDEEHDDGASALLSRAVVNHEQAGRSASVGAKHYGRSSARDMRGTTLTRLTAMRISSERWHSLLFGFENETMVCRISDKHNYGVHGTWKKKAPKSIPLHKTECHHNQMSQESKQLPRYSHTEKMSMIQPSELQRERWLDLKKERGEVVYPLLKYDPCEWEHDATIFVQSDGSCRRFLKDFFRSERAFFKSETQESGVNFVLQRKTNLLAIMPTGEGKSLLFMLPAFIEQNKADEAGKLCPVSILAIPTVALTEDLLNRCNENGIRAVTWKNRMDGNPSIVVVAVEQIGSKEYSSFVDMLVNDERLSRFVFDEAHVILSWGSIFRESLNSTGYLMRPPTAFGFPIVLLTASLSQENQKELLQHFRIECSTRILRTKTVRPNIAYCVERITPHQFCDTTDMENLRHRVVSTILQHISSWDAEMERGESVLSRVIVYFRSIRELELCCKEFNNSATGDIALQFRGKKTRLEKKHAFVCWRAGRLLPNAELGVKEDDATKARVIMATDAFGLGVDYPSVRLVVHCGVPENIDSYIQQSGRAGGDGKPSYSVVILHDRKGDSRKNYSQDLQEACMESILQQKKFCIRKLIFGYMDGRSTTCFYSSTRKNATEIPYILCENCRNQEFLQRKPMITSCPSKRNKDELKVDPKNICPAAPSTFVEQEREKGMFAVDEDKINQATVVERMGRQGKRFRAENVSQKVVEKETHSNEDETLLREDKQMTDEQFCVRKHFHNRSEIDEDNTGADALCQRERPSMLFEEYDKNPAKIVETSRTRALELWDVCPLCLSMTGVFVRHGTDVLDDWNITMRACPNYRKLCCCFRCMSPQVRDQKFHNAASHNAADCAVKHVMDKKSKSRTSMCFGCGLPNWFAGQKIHIGIGYGPKKCKLGRLIQGIIMKWWNKINQGKLLEKYGYLGVRIVIDVHRKDCRESGGFEEFYSWAITPIKFEKFEILPVLQMIYDL